MPEAQTSEEDRKVPKKVCAALVLDEVKRSHTDVRVGALGAGLIVISTVATPVAGVAVAMGLAAYFGWRWREVLQKMKYLREKYGL